MPSVILDFTDGDTMKRFTITDPNVGPSSEINVAIRKLNILDRDDKGYLYVANVVTVAAGSFDVLAGPIPADADLLAAIEPPNEIVSLVYLIQP